MGAVPRPISIAIMDFYLENAACLVENQTTRKLEAGRQKAILIRQLQEQLLKDFGVVMDGKQIRTHWQNKKGHIFRKAKDLMDRRSALSTAGNPMDAPLPNVFDCPTEQRVLEYLLTVERPSFERSFIMDTSSSGCSADRKRSFNVKDEVPEIDFKMPKLEDLLSRTYQLQEPDISPHKYSHLETLLGSTNASDMFANSPIKSPFTCSSSPVVDIQKLLTSIVRDELAQTSPDSASCSPVMNYSTLMSPIATPAAESIQNEVEMVRRTKMGDESSISDIQKLLTFKVKHEPAPTSPPGSSQCSPVTNVSTLTSPNITQKKKTPAVCQKAVEMASGTTMGDGLPNSPTNAPFTCPPSPVVDIQNIMTSMMRDEPTQTSPDSVSCSPAVHYSTLVPTVVAQEVSTSATETSQKEEIVADRKLDGNSATLLRDFFQNYQTNNEKLQSAITILEGSVPAVNTLIQMQQNILKQQEINLQAVLGMISSTTELVNNVAARLAKDDAFRLQESSLASEYMDPKHSATDRAKGSRINGQYMGPQMLCDSSTIYSPMNSPVSIPSFSLSSPYCMPNQLNSPTGMYFPPSFFNSLCSQTTSKFFLTPNSIVASESDGSAVANAKSFNNRCN